MGRVRVGLGARLLSLAVGRIRGCLRVRGCSSHCFESSAGICEFGDELPVVGSGEDDSAEDEARYSARVHLGSFGHEETRTVGGKSGAGFFVMCARDSRDASSV